MVSKKSQIPMVKLEIHSTIKIILNSIWTKGIIFGESFFYSRLILRELQFVLGLFIRPSKTTCNYL